MTKMTRNSMAVLVSIYVFFMLGHMTVLAASPAVVNLGTAGNFVVLSKSGVSTTGTTLLTGSVGVSPIDHTALTGFSEVLDSSNTFSTSIYVIGKLYASDYAIPTPTYVGTAVSDMGTAYTDANSRVADNTDPGTIGSCATACDLSGLILVPGVYTFSGPGNLVITGDVTLDGGLNDVWIFRIPGTLNISSSKKVLLTGGARSANVFWAVAGATTLGTNSTFEGNVLEAGSVIAMQTGARLNGRALSQFAITLDANTISLPLVLIPDTTPPVITILGSSSMNLTVGDVFTDPGATALDGIDGQVLVTASGVVNTTLAGSYVITYNATDAASNTATPATRMVIVSATIVPPVSPVVPVVPVVILVADLNVVEGRGSRSGGRSRDVSDIFVENNTMLVASVVLTPVLTPVATPVATPVVTPVVTTISGFPDTGLAPMGEFSDFIYSIFGMPVQDSYPVYSQAVSGHPARLKIPKINVDADIESIGLTTNGRVDTPREHTNAGWFNLGPRPGEKGSAVIDGHYGWIGRVPAVFDNLSKIEKGDQIYVGDKEGSTITFVVTKVKIYGEGDDASNVFNSDDGSAHLNLITCIGDWNATGQSYPSRLVVFSDRKI